MTMGRVFTINFDFEQKATSALVYMQEKGYNILFKVHVFNEELYPLLPAGKMEFSFLEGLKTPGELTHQKTRQLISCLTEKIAQYLQAGSDG